jgi:hypothetical protein
MKAAKQFLGPSMEHDTSDIYHCGFLDGDGCVQLGFPTNRIASPIPVISTGQSCNSGEPPELIDLQARFGGIIYKSISGDGHDLRDAWKLNIVEQSEVRRLLSVMAKHCVVKRSQADLGLKYLHSGRLHPVQHATLVRDAKLRHSTIDIDTSILTPAYHFILTPTLTLTLKKGNHVIWLGGKGPTALSWNDMLILGKEAEPHGGIRVISYDPLENSYMVECSVHAIGAIDARNKRDAAARGEKQKSPPPSKKKKSKKQKSAKRIKKQ